MIVLHSGSGAAMPAYLAGKAAHEWVEVSGTVHAGSAAAPGDDPNQEACASNNRLAYSNFAVVGTKIILPASGGHSDYGDNEVTNIDILVGSPAWSLLKAKTAVVTSNADTNASDDTPTSRHLYSEVHYSTTHSRLILHATQGWFADGASSGRSFGFNLANNTWDASSTWGDSNKAASCRDSHDNCWAILNTSGHQLFKWTAATNTWAQTLTAGSGPGNEIAHDSTHDRLMSLTCGNGVGGSGMNGAVYTSDGTVMTSLTLTGSGLAQMNADLPFQNSLEYDRFNDRFLHWNGVTSHLFSIVVSGSVGSFTGTVTLVSTTGTPPPTRVKEHGRMRIIDSLRTAFFMPSGTKNLYAMRLA
jgi:hypothetical protein